MSNPAGFENDDFGMILAEGWMDENRQKLGPDHFSKSKIHIGPVQLQPSNRKAFWFCQQKPFQTKLFPGKIC